MVSLVERGSRSQADDVGYASFALDLLGTSGSGSKSCDFIVNTLKEAESRLPKTPANQAARLASVR